LGRRRFHPQGILALLVLIGAGCGLFEPRDPRSATPIPQERCRVRTSADSVVANITLHYGRGTDCYAAQVDSGFQFIPDPQDYLQRDNPPSLNPFDDWNRDVEVGVSQTISTRADTVLVSFDSTYAAKTTTTNPTRETRYYNYHVLVIAAPTDTTQSDTTRYQGQAEMTFVQRTTDYTLESFRDHRDGSVYPTWGSLRADQRLGQ
jgi:hypothetical protein